MPTDVVVWQTLKLMNWCETLKRYAAQQKFAKNSIFVQGAEVQKNVVVIFFQGGQSEAKVNHVQLRVLARSQLHLRVSLDPQDLRRSQRAPVPVSGHRQRPQQPARPGRRAPARDARRARQESRASRSAAAQPRRPTHGVASQGTRQRSSCARAFSHASLLRRWHVRKPLPTR